ncbi:MAG: FmdB family transcriptional regulator [Dehalococcoidia bacterium]|nr:FmdB family transcriptional regulator [Dehalococcoidia bacterium]
MPIYQYKCDECESTFELRQAFNDKSIATCPVCQGSARRVFSPVPIIFKGPGFYVTDSRSGAKNPAAAPPPESKSGGSASKVTP